MAGNPLLSSLEQFKAGHGRAVRIPILYTGGTFGCYEGKEGLTPIKTEEALIQLIDDALGLGELKNVDLLESRIHFLFAKDSSQMNVSDRDKIIEAITPMYPN